MPHILCRMKGMPAHWRETFKSLAVPGWLDWLATEALAPPTTVAKSACKSGKIFRFINYRGDLSTQIATVREGWQHVEERNSG
ncbi:hypothetical protein ANCCAN_17101 [Ancylostoma caninum]|uniref:Uncharacterized protein n=1 Tax=Ancylostoma caninum TaxID=29170 RepID=A0A368G339_ANCCA|nr:hypothetical protein ANCCAN_17101 [Ancylostoma caninum]